MFYPLSQSYLIFAINDVKDQKLKSIFLPKITTKNILQSISIINYVFHDMMHFVLHNTLWYNQLVIAW